MGGIAAGRAGPAGNRNEIGVRRDPTDLIRGKVGDRRLLLRNGQRGQGGPHDAGQDTARKTSSTYS